MFSEGLDQNLQTEALKNQKVSDIFRVIALKFGAASKTSHNPYGLKLHVHASIRFCRCLDKGLVNTLTYSVFQRG
jgi:hypothetical protein